MAFSDHDAAVHIRFTAFLAPGQTSISAAVREFRLAFPEIAVEVVSTETRLDLMAGAADVAMRVGAAPQENGLVIRRLLTDGWSVWCSRDYAAEHGVPQTPGEFAHRPVITLSEAFHNLLIVQCVTRWCPKVAS